MTELTKGVLAWMLLGAFCNATVVAVLVGVLGWSVSALSVAIGLVGNVLTGGMVGYLIHK